MLGSLIFFAQGDGGGSGMLFFVMLFGILIFLWLFVMSPQKKQEERLRKMLDSLEKNDRVMTVGGLLGTVHAVDKEQNEIVLKVDDANNTKIHFNLTAISTVFPKEDNDKK